MNLSKVIFSFFALNTLSFFENIQRVILNSSLRFQINKFQDECGMFILGKEALIVFLMKKKGAFEPLRGNIPATEEEKEVGFNLSFISGEILTSVASWCTACSVPFITTTRKFHYKM